MARQFDYSNLVTPAVILIGGAFLLRELKKMFDKGKDAGKETGEKISEKLFDLFNPALRAPDRMPTYTKATAVKRVGPDGKTTWNAYTCPTGYHYKKTATGHYCFRDEPINANKAAVEDALT